MEHRDLYGCVLFDGRKLTTMDDYREVIETSDRWHNKHDRLNTNRFSLENIKAMTQHREQLFLNPHDDIPPYDQWDLFLIKHSENDVNWHDSEEWDGKYLFGYWSSGFYYVVPNAFNLRTILYTTNQMKGDPDDPIGMGHLDTFYGRTAIVATLQEDHFGRLFINDDHLTKTQVPFIPYSTWMFLGEQYEEMKKNWYEEPNYVVNS